MSAESIPNAIPLRLFAANMWAVYNFDDPNVRYRKFCNCARPAFKMAIDGLILHDEIVVPTDDFLSLTALVGVLGENAVVALLESGCLKFVRVRGALAYIGNGAGLRHFEIGSTEGQDQAFCAPIDAAVDWALGGLDTPVQSPRLRQLVVQATAEVDLSDIWQDIRHETYMDILNSTLLRGVFTLRNEEMDALAGIGPKEVRIFGGPSSDWRGDEIGIVLALAATNLELRMLEIVGASNASTACPVGHVLRAKAERRFGIDAARGFAVLREIAGVPDIGECILKKQFTVEELIHLRETRNAGQFRKWFHENCRTDPVSTAREYAVLLREVPSIQLFPVRVLRFIVTTALGLFPGGGVVGTIASSIDNFFLDRWLRGQSPKVFIDDLSQVGNDPE